MVGDEWMKVKGQPNTTTAATANAGNDLDHTVSIGVLQQIQIMFSFK